jgi:hypothetical protein
MPYQVSRTDTGQFVLRDPATDAVVIDDDLAQGFAKLEQAVASNPAPATPAAPPPAATDRATQGSSAFEFRGGSRYTPILLAVVLPFAWLAVLYFALANLLSEVALDDGASKQTETRIEELEREVKALRSEIAGAPRTGKTTPMRKAGRKPNKADELEDVEIGGNDEPDDAAEPDDADDDAKAKAAEPPATPDARKTPS